MYRIVRHVLCLAAACAAISSCNPPAQNRYYLTTEKLPNGTVTSVMDSKSNTQLLYIAELGLKPPSITVLPVSRLDVESVSVGPVTGDDVTIRHKSEPDKIVHTIAITSDEGMPQAMNTFDTDFDGTVDNRWIGFPTRTGYVRYVDVDGNGFLDAQLEIFMGETSTSRAHILVKNTWIAVNKGTDFSATSPLVAETLDDPAKKYRFKDGEWIRDESPDSG